jgi:hypothetical protein
LAGALPAEMDLCFQHGMDLLDIVVDCRQAGYQAKADKSAANNTDKGMPFHGVDIVVTTSHHVLRLVNNNKD